MHSHHTALETSDIGGKEVCDLADIDELASSWRDVRDLVSDETTTVVSHDHSSRVKHFHGVLRKEGSHN